MTQLHISAFEMLSLYVPEISRALGRFAKPHEAAHFGDPVGCEIQIYRDRDGETHITTPGSYIIKTDFGFVTRAWKMLDDSNPMRERIGLALLELALALENVVHRPGMEEAIDTLSSSASGGAYYALGMLPEGFYLIANDAQQRLQTQSWDHAKPSQAMMNEIALLLWPDCASAHERLSLSPHMSHVQEVMLSLHQLSWAEKDPLPVAFSSTPMDA